MYIYEQQNWPEFVWKRDLLLEPLARATFLQGTVLGRMKGLGFSLQRESTWHVVTQNIMSSSAIEGELLDLSQVRSSVARHLSVPHAGAHHIDHHVDGMVTMMFNALHGYQDVLSLEHICNWHAALFPTGYSGIRTISVGKLRTDAEGPMLVVSSTRGPTEIIHFQAPPAIMLVPWMLRFLEWINSPSREHPFIRAAIAHLWFVTLHPFDEGNGRLARAISDMMLCRADGTVQRFYSMSAHIEREKETYYDILEHTQKGSLDITRWLIWFLECLARSIEASSIVDSVLRKARFWQEATRHALNEHQHKMLNLLLDDFKGNLTSSKWAKICKVSQDTAGREIKDLVQKGLLQQEGRGRSTHYLLVDFSS